MNSKKNSGEIRPVRVAEALQGLSPVAFMAAFVMFYYSQNAGEHGVKEALPLLAWAIAGVLSLQLVFAVACRSWRRAALFTVVCVLFFIVYGAVVDLLGGSGKVLLVVAGRRVGLNKVMLPLWSGIFLWTMFTMVRYRRRMDRYVPLTAAIGVSLLIIGVVRATRSAVNDIGSTTRYGSEPTAPIAGTANLPHIFYIVPDGYPSAHVLGTRFGFDNLDFVAWLESRGFRVMRRNHANYMQTRLCFSSILNMRYLDQAADTQPDHVTGIRRLIEENLVFRMAQEAGYETVFVGNLSNIGGAVRMRDRLGYGPYHGEYLSGFLNMTVLRGVSGFWERLGGRPAAMDVEGAYSHHRAAVRYALENASRLADSSRPVFAMIHFLCPHVPLVFDADGSPVPGREPYAEAVSGKRRRAGGEPPRRAYAAGTVAQVKFVNTELKAMIDDILKRSPRPVVIVLQADHGTDLGVDWKSPEVDDVAERLGNLCALRFPDGDSRLICEPFSSVNTFRAVFAKVLGKPYEPLENRAFWSSADKQVDFVDVTGAVNRDLSGVRP